MNNSLEPKLAIQTPEQVEFEYELAGLGSRFLAFLFDGLVRVFICLVVLLLMAIVLFLASKIFSVFKPIPALSEKTPDVPTWLFVIIIVTFHLVNFGYYIFFETIWSGQTPGKKLLNLRVIREGGYPVGFYESAIRNFFRIIDAMPINYLVGVLSILLSPKEKRVGDYVAGTIVIKEKKGEIPERLFQHTEVDSKIKQSEIEELKEIFPNLVNIQREEYNMVVDFLKRRDQVELARREFIANFMTASVIKKVNFTLPEGMSCEDFLLCFARVYEAQMKFL